MTIPATGSLSIRQMATEVAYPANQPRSFNEIRLRHLMSNTASGPTPNVAQARGRTWLGFTTGYNGFSQYGYTHGLRGSSVKGQTFIGGNIMYINAFVNDRPDTFDSRNRMSFVVYNTTNGGTVPTNLFDSIYFSNGASLLAIHAVQSVETLDGGGSQRVWTWFSTGLTFGSGMSFEVVID